ncbi:hypothetical protein ACLESO_14555, partial [Pyxidicoccus sp. 3LG]
RARLGVADGDDRPVVAVMGCGNPAEVEEAGAIASRLQARLGAAALVRWLVPPGAAGSARVAEALRVSVWPALAVLPGVDVLVGAGGYNTVQEARVTGTPFVALARPRLYDRQALRLRPGELARSVEELEARAVLLARTLPPRGPGPFTSGTRDAVALIERAALSA